MTTATITRRPAMRRERREREGRGHGLTPREKAALEAIESWFRAHGASNEKTAKGAGHA